MFFSNQAEWFPIFAGAACKSAAVLVIAWIAARLLRRQSASARHLAWTAGAAALLALPFLSATLPAWRIPAPVLQITTPVFQTTGSARPDATVPRAGAPAPRPTASSEAARWQPDWRMGLMLLWIGGTLIAFLQLAMAYLAVWRVRRSARFFGDRDLCRALSRELGIRHSVRVFETGAGRMPMTAGLLRPAVFLPSGAAQWSVERRRVVLLHELAHVRRYDVATQWLGRVALSLYWWNPLAWIACRELMNERERAADDLVLSTGTRASEYAGHLLDVAKSMQSGLALGWMAVAMARRSQLEGRVAAILDPRINRHIPGRAGAWVAALAAIALVAPLAAVHAQDVPARSIPAGVDAAIRAKNHEILENAAKAAEESRNYETAHRLLQAATALRAEVFGANSVDYGIGLLKIADLEQTRHNASAASEFYTKAAGVLGDRPQAAHALMHLGAFAAARKDYTQAFDYFERAQRVDPVHSGPALRWMALLRQREYNFYEAEMLYRKALSVQDSNSTEAAVTMQVFSQFLRQQGRADESSDLDARASAVIQANTQLRPALSSGVYRIGGGVAAPSVLQKVEPEYSEEARIAKWQGTVVVSVEIGADGLAHNPQIVRSLGLGLDEKAVDALSQWSFSPGLKDGQPVAVAAAIEVNFKLL